MTGESLPVLVDRLRAKIDEIEAAVIRYRDGHDGPCLNYEGQDPAAYDEFEPCAIHVLTARATPYRDVAFGLRTIQAHRRIIDAWCAADHVSGFRMEDCTHDSPETGVAEGLKIAVEALASIYFPESETPDG